ncbi:M1 family metallopeptidase [Lysobacter sp. MMG2]|nr:M1 family metallopeptidase [Lysobacter sp. MMG2]
MDFGIALTLGATALGLVARFTLPGLQVGVIARATSLLLATWLLVVLPAYAGSQLPSAEVAAIDVRSYSARIEPDLARGSLHGQVRIDLRVLTAAPELEFDAGELVIDAVREDGVALPFAMEGGRLRITLPRAARPGERHALDIGYHGTPRFGLQFQPQRGELYTIFSTDQWLVCINAPRERATLDLSVVLPADVTAVGNGRALPVRRLADGRSLHRWRQSVPVPSYVYGFAAGRYTQVHERAGPARLRYLSVDLDAQQLRQVFADTGDMLRFFGERAGRPYRGDYTQALVARTVGQELAGFSLMSESYGLQVLERPTAQGLIAHEAAHQWWGNMVTCEDWTHFWLNEGFASFMAAAYLQHRFGDEEYRKQVEGWMQRLERLRAAGTDRALVFDNWDKPTADDRAVVYQKGAYVIHLLREELGEDVFWRGIGEYTRAYYGRSVNTADFQQAMQRVSDKDLSAFFDRWVYGHGDTRPPLDEP